MIIFPVMGLSFVVVFNSIALSYQFDCLPNGAPIPGTPRIRKSSRRHQSPRSSSTSSHPAFGVSSNESYPVGFPDSGFLPAASPPLEFPDIMMPFENEDSLENPPPGQPALRLKSRSPTSSPPPTSRCIVPPIMLPPVNGRRYGLEHYKSIRLIPYANPRLEFQLREYTFLGNTKVKLRTERNVYVPLPTQEQIVISTSNYHVFAILEHSQVLAGLYVSPCKRVRINMRSGEITKLTPGEVAEFPVGPRRPITTHFRVILREDV